MLWSKTGIVTVLEKDDVMILKMQLAFLKIDLFYSQEMECK